MRFDIFSRRSLLAAVLVLCAGACSAVDFRADMSTKMGNMRVTGKLYVCGDNWRQETRAQGHQQIAIGRGNIIYAVDPATKQYREVRGRVRPWSATATSEMYCRAMNRKATGRQNIGGFSCERAVYTPKKTPGQYTITQYVAKNLDLPIRTEMKSAQGTLLVEFKNIKKAKSPAALFTIPKGYRKVGMPQQVKPPAKRR